MCWILTWHCKLVLSQVPLFLDMSAPTWLRPEGYTSTNQELHTQGLKIPNFPQILFLGTLYYTSVKPTLSHRTHSTAQKRQIIYFFPMRIHQSNCKIGILLKHSFLELIKMTLERNLSSRDSYKMSHIELYLNILNMCKLLQNKGGKDHYFISKRFL